MMKKYFYFALLILSLAACGNDKKETDDRFTIKGKISNLGSKQVYLEISGDNNQWMIVDTSDVGADGSYLVQSTLENPEVFRITWDRNYVIAFVDSNRQVIELNADAVNPYTTMEVKGSQATEQFSSFNKRMELYNNEAENLDSLKRAAIANKDQKEEQRVKTLILQQRKNFNQFVKANIDSVGASLPAILWLTNYVDINTDVDFYVKVNNRFQKEAPRSRLAGALNDYVTRAAAEIFIPGHPAPDFVLYDPDGREVKLSKFKGKYLLIDFWASWCAPCRKENPNVVRLYQKYHSKGLEILGISQDQTRDAWLGAIKDDGLVWDHAWDTNRKVADSYHVTGIPATFLIDKEGKIIVQGLRGEALEQKIDELLN